jgi:hypothetical protein
MTMHVKHEIGDRVRVAVPDHKRHTWAVGSVDVLQGRLRLTDKRGIELLNLRRAEGIQLLDQRSKITTPRPSSASSGLRSTAAADRRAQSPADPPPLGIRTDPRGHRHNRWVTIPPRRNYRGGSTSAPKMDQPEGAAKAIAELEVLAVLLDRLIEGYRGLR